MQLVQFIVATPEQYIGEEWQKRIPPPSECPHCQRENTLWALGYYKRYLSRLEAGALTLFIRRFRCCHCKYTISILPDFAHPYRLIRTQTIERYIQGVPFPPEVLRHLVLLSQYLRQFSRWLPEMDRTLGNPLERAPPCDPREAWTRLLSDYQDLADMTQNLTRVFRITVFGRYRCHYPNERPVE